MKIKFESDIAYQSKAIHSIVDIFQGQERMESNFTVYSPKFINQQQNMEMKDIGVGNRLAISERKLIHNVQKIQLRNGLQLSEPHQININQLDFSIEMETGTGKTYVYLRSIMEMYQKYQFTKFIIVVPSISIREGVLKSLEITKSHFRELYNNMPYRFFEYDSSSLSGVRDFAISDKIEIMVINIDSFSKSFKNPNDGSKKVNIIHRYNDSLGYTPLNLIKSTSPIVIVDEPQTTMSTPIRKNAIKSLNPMTVLRYSATHKEKINLMYQLDAVDAYQQNLVKQIEVGSVQLKNAHNKEYIHLEEIKSQGGVLKAKVEIDFYKSNKIQRKSKWVKQGDDLAEITKRVIYEGYIIQDIYAHEDNQYITFTSKPAELKVGDSIGKVDNWDVKRIMIRKTIEEHLDKEMILNKLGIKVLSLFFIDSVSKYRQYDEDGNANNGEYAEMFERQYMELSRLTKYKTLFDENINIEDEASIVHNGYFSIDKQKKKSNNKEKFEYFKDTSGKIKADEDTYNLIMKDKETLLSMYDGKDPLKKVRFIFSHSALKEGWDNPNVFQICTLKDVGGSEIRRRQEIGRGLRICVNQDGDRVYGHEVNTLTVIASESYKEYVDKLQHEYETDRGVKFGVLLPNSFNNVVVEISEEGEPKYFGQSNSEELHNHLLREGYIDLKGNVQDELKKALLVDTLSLPDNVINNESVAKQIYERIKAAAGKLEIKNQEDKQSVRTNKKVLNSPEFKALWDRVKFKTTFAVDFDSDKLIKACIRAIDNQLYISQGKIHFEKSTIDVTEGGINIIEETEIKETYTSSNTVKSLPDIVGFLQNETNLTRKSIVEILAGTQRLSLFKVNPQAFIESCIDIINTQMKQHIINGIQYKKLGDSEFYSQELFQNEELFGYIESNLTESTKSPYEYVVYDSSIESKMTDEFEKSNNISVYAKLPGWFKIDTPLGTYNPDWAIMWTENGKEQLFFVVESKGSSNQMDLRFTENGKIYCGKKHFDAIGSRMIVASDMKEVEDKVIV